MLTHFEVLLRGAVAAPDAPCGGCRSWTPKNEQTLVSRRLPPQRPPTTDTVVELFERQAAMRGGEIAMLYRDRRITYGELNRRANQLARVLHRRRRGTGARRRVVMDRTPDWIVAMLARKGRRRLHGTRAGLSRRAASRLDGSQPRHAGRRGRALPSNALHGVAAPVIGPGRAAAL